VTADKNPIEDAVEQALDAFVYAPIGLLFDGPARFPKLVRNGKSQVNNARMLGPFALQQARAEVQRRTADLDGPVVDLLRGLGVVPGPPPGPAPAPRPATATPATSAPADEAPARATTMPAPEVVEKAEKAPKKAAKKATKRSAPAPAAKRPATKKAAAKKAPAKAAPAAKAAAPASDAEANRAAAEEAVAARTAATDAATPSADVLPIPDYDSLSASQVVSRLQGLSAGQLDAIRAYETATRSRKTILNRVQQLSKP